MYAGLTEEFAKSNMRPEQMGLIAFSNTVLHSPPRSVLSSAQRQPVEARPKLLNVMSFSAQGCEKPHEGQNTSVSPKHFTKFSLGGYKAPLHLLTVALVVQNSGK